jgi:hypothetical protein
MFSVPIGSERLAAPVARLRYVDRLPGWACTWPYGDREIELRISGDEGSPDGRLLVLAGLVLPHLEALERVADAYLRSFFTHLDAYDGPWTLQLLRLGMPGPADPIATDFDVGLANRGDDHGEWRVGFRRHAIPQNQVTARFFSRTQW